MKGKINSLQSSSTRTSRLNPEHSFGRESYPSTEDAGLSTGLSKRKKGGDAINNNTINDNNNKKQQQTNKQTNNENKKQNKAKNN